MFANNENVRVEKAKKEVTGLYRITKKRLLELCKKDKLYQTPALNDVLYLHYQGFQYIECLEEYTELKCLWLECNAISEIQGLENQTKIKCLFLQSNLINRIENLQHCIELDTLNLSLNNIHMVENCGSDILPNLSTLNLSSNYLKCFNDLQDLENCKTLTVLDLSNNRIDDLLVVKIFGKMPKLRVLVLHGNPVVSKLPQYRKTLILECKELTYLDSRPVFPKDRACAEAWKRGGYAEERMENNRWNRLDRKKQRDSVNATICLRNRHLSPDKQFPLIESSDSDDEGSAAKLRQKDIVDADVDLKMRMWDEVDDEISVTSADLKESESSESGAFNTGTLDTADVVENINVEDKLRNDSPDKQLKLYDIDNYVKITHTITDGEQQTKETPIEPNGCAAADSDNESDGSGTKEDYNKTVQAIEHITMNDLSCAETPRRSVQLQIEVNDDPQSYEPEKEMDEIMERMMENSAKGAEGNQFCQFEVEFEVNKKVNEMEHNRHCMAVNKELKQNFELMVKEMDEKLMELQKDQDNLCGDESIIHQAASNNSSSTESDFGKEEELNIERVLDYWNKKKVIDSNQIASIVDHDPSYEETVALLSLECKNSSEVLELVAVGDTLQASQKAMWEATADGDCMQPNRKDAEKKDLAMALEPLDEVQCKSHALLAFEEESVKLHTLLQELEDENERLYTINTEYRKVLEEDIREEFKYKDKESNECSQKLCECIIEDLLEELDLQQRAQPTKPKSYIFEELVSDEEFSYGGQAKEEQTHTKTIRQVIDSFNDFMEEVTRKNREAVETRRGARKKVKSTDEEKAESLRKLLHSPKLQEIHSGTSDSLDAQLFTQYEKEKADIKKLVDRIYSKKDRYADALELLEGRLVVIKKDSGAIQELSVQSAEISNDTDNFYETTQSDNDYTEHRWGMPATPNSMWSQPFKPTARKSSEQLVQAALARGKEQADNLKTDDNNSDDEFHSFETKENLFGEIDEEFFTKLDLEQLQIKEEDENRIAVCARSYEELKRFIKADDKERCIGTEEDELVTKMLAHVKKDGVTDPPGDSTTDAENLLLKKMVQRTREKEGDLASDNQMKIDYVVENTKQKILESGKQDKNDTDDEFHSFETQDGSVGEIDEEFFRKLYLEQLQINENDENHTVECARSYEELKRFIEVGDKERCVGAEEDELVTKMLAHVKTDGKTDPPGNSETDAENSLFKKVVQCIGEKEGDLVSDSQINVGYVVKSTKQKMLESGRQNNNDTDDEFHSFESKESSLVEIDEELFRKLYLEQLQIKADDENHIEEFARSYEEFKRFIKVNDQERCIGTEEDELVTKMLAHVKKDGETDPPGDSATDAENLLLKKMVQCTREKEGDLEPDSQMKIDYGVKNANQKMLESGSQPLELYDYIAKANPELQEDDSKYLLEAMEKPSPLLMVEEIDENECKDDSGCFRPAVEIDDEKIGEDYEFTSEIKSAVVAVTELEQAIGLENIGNVPFEEPLTNLPGNAAAETEAVPGEIEKASFKNIENYTVDTPTATLPGNAEAKIKTESEQIEEAPNAFGNIDNDPLGAAVNTPPGKGEIGIEPMSGQEGKISIALDNIGDVRVDAPKITDQ